MDNNELKLEKTTVCTQKTVLDEIGEQPIEKDIILPDYYPDIFRVLKCTVIPCADSHSINGGRLSYELSALVRVWYLEEDSSRIYSIEQNVSYSRSCDIDSDVLDPTVIIDPSCDYVNCRVANSRRLDIRGALSVHIKACGTELSEIITKAEGAGIETKLEELTYPAKRLTAAKRITLIEELELSRTKPQIGAVLRSSCRVSQKEHKMIAGKLITKGDAELTLLYSCVDSQGEDTVESMSFSLPFSQIIDIDGIDDTFDAQVDISCSECEIIPKSEDSSSAECEIVLFVRCTAIKYEQANAVTDAFSTLYDTELSEISGFSDAGSAEIADTAEVSASLAKNGEGINCVYDCTAECTKADCRFDEESGKLSVSGNVCFRLLGKNSEGTPVFIEKDAAFEKELTAEGISADSLCDISAEVSSCSYRLTSDSTADANAVIQIKGTVHSKDIVTALSDIKADTSKPAETSDTATIRLCRCDAGEDIWSVAKRCRASVDAILESNELTADDPISGILLVPQC